MKIQKPTVGLVVHYHVLTPSRQGDRTVAVVAALPAIVLADAAMSAQGLISLTVLGYGSNCMPFGDVHAVPYSSSGREGTWRYPPRCDDQIEVDDE